MSDDVRRKLVSNSSIRTYDPNYTIYKQGRLWKLNSDAQATSLLDKWHLSLKTDQCITLPSRKLVHTYSGYSRIPDFVLKGTGVRLGDLGVIVTLFHRGSEFQAIAFPQSLKIDYFENSGKKKKVILSTENQSELEDWLEILRAGSVTYKYSVWRHRDVPVVDEVEDRPPALYQVVVVGVANMQMIADEDEGGGVVKLSMVCGDHFGEINRWGEFSAQNKVCTREKEIFCFCIDRSSALKAAVLVHAQARELVHRTALLMEVSLKLHFVAPGCNRQLTSGAQTFDSTEGKAAHALGEHKPGEGIWLVQKGDFIGDIHFFAGAELQEQSNPDDRKPPAASARPRRRESLFTTAKIEIVEDQQEHNWSLVLNPPGQWAWECCADKEGAMILFLPNENVKQLPQAVLLDLLTLAFSAQPSAGAKDNLSSSPEGFDGTRTVSSFATYIASRHPFSSLRGLISRITNKSEKNEEIWYKDRAVDGKEDEIHIKIARHNAGWRLVDSSCRYADKEASNPFSIAGTLSSAQSTEEAADETLAAGRALALKEFEKAARNKRSWIRHTNDMHKRVQMRSEIPFFVFV
eukprot:39790-Hanusia_phi.AAC.2